MVIRSRQTKNAVCVQILSSYKRSERNQTKTAVCAQILSPHTNSQKEIRSKKAKTRCFEHKYYHHNKRSERNQEQTAKHYFLKSDSSFSSSPFSNCS